MLLSRRVIGLAQNGFGPWHFNSTPVTPLVLTLPPLHSVLEAYIYFDMFITFSYQSPMYSLQAHMYPPPVACPSIQPGRRSFPFRARLTLLFLYLGSSRVSGFFLKSYDYSCLLHISVCFYRVSHSNLDGSRSFTHSLNKCHPECNRMTSFLEALSPYLNAMSESQIPAERNSEQNADSDVLALLGKKQVLKRRFGLISIFGFAMCELITWETVLALFSQGFENGGPAGLVYGFLIAWVSRRISGGLCFLSSFLIAVLLVRVHGNIRACKYGPDQWGAVLLGVHARSFEVEEIYQLPHRVADFLGLGCYSRDRDDFCGHYAPRYRRPRLP